MHFRYIFYQDNLILHNIFKSRWIVLIVQGGGNIKIKQCEPQFENKRIEA